MSPNRGIREKYRGVSLPEFRHMVTKMNPRADISEMAVALNEMSGRGVKTIYNVLKDLRIKDAKGLRNSLINMKKLHHYFCINKLYLISEDERFAMMETEAMMNILLDE